MSDGEYQSFWRIAKSGRNYKATDLSGDGGRYVGGRWHRQGTPVIYTASSIALATLETLAHYDSSGLPFQRFLIELRIPAAVVAQATTLEPPDGWDTVPAGVPAADAGMRWLTAGTSLLCFVPSVIVRKERNLLINPLHADVAQIVVEDHGVFEYDPRLLGKL